MKKITLRAITLLIVIFGVVISASSAQAITQPMDFEALDAFILEQMEKHGLPGVALTVISGDEIIYAKGYGTDGNRLMTPSTLMLIGSQSKSFTALAIAQLAEQGKIDFNERVQSYLPWFRVADEAASGRLPSIIYCTIPAVYPKPASAGFSHPIPQWKRWFAL